MINLPFYYISAREIRGIWRTLEAFHEPVYILDFNEINQIVINNATYMLLYIEQTTGKTHRNSQKQVTL